MKWAWHKFPTDFIVLTIYSDLICLFKLTNECVNYNLHMLAVAHRKQEHLQLRLVSNNYLETVCI